MAKELIIKKIMEAKINKEIDLSDTNYFKYVYFTQKSEYDLTYEFRGCYSWVGELNKAYFNRTLFPMKDSNYVKYFKTLKGAKRNFIRQYINKGE